MRLYFFCSAVQPLDHARFLLIMWLLYFYCWFYPHMQVTFWVWLFTVFTFSHPPLTYVCHMLFEIFSFDDHIAIFVDTRDTFGGARLQVHLLETIIIWERMIKWSFSPWSIVELGSGMSLSNLINSAFSCFQYPQNNVSYECICRGFSSLLLVCYYHISSAWVKP